MDANFHIFLLNVLSVVIALVVGYSLGKSDAEKQLNTEG